MTSHPSPFLLSSAYFLTFLAPLYTYMHPHMHIDTKAFSHSNSHFLCVLFYSRAIAL